MAKSNMFKFIQWKKKMYCAESHILNMLTKYERQQYISFMLGIIDMPLTTILNVSKIDPLYKITKKRSEDWFKLLIKLNGKNHNQLINEWIKTPKEHIVHFFWQSGKTSGTMSIKDYNKLMRNRLMYFALVECGVHFEIKRMSKL